ncbi:MAG: HIT family protein [Candidatus Adiutrix sp.]
MDTMWAPWRMSYIEKAGAKECECFLCLPPNHIGPDRTKFVLFSDKTVLIMLNLYPYNNGHLLIAPRRHIPNLSAATTSERGAIIEWAARASEILSEKMNPAGFNMGINQGRVAGGSVEAHLHFHVTPRYLGDCNYMAAIGETKVISQHILATFDKLVNCFND